MGSQVVSTKFREIPQYSKMFIIQRLQQPYQLDQLPGCCSASSGARAPCRWGCSGRRSSWRRRWRRWAPAPIRGEDCGHVTSTDQSQLTCSPGLEPIFMSGQADIILDTETTGHWRDKKSFITLLSSKLSCSLIRRSKNQFKMSQPYLLYLR